jgi:hypothetical protein
MARYLLSAPAYIKEGYYPAGAIVELPDDYPVGPHMLPAVVDGQEDAAARRALDAYNQDKGHGPAPGDPAFIGDMIAHTLAGGETNGRVVVTSTAAPVAGVGVVTDQDGVVRSVASVPQPSTGAVTDAPGFTVPIKAGPDASEVKPVTSEEAPASEEDQASGRKTRKG